MKILFIDDEAEILEYFVEYLSGKGLEVVSADNGLKAIELVKEHNSFDVLITDANLPGASGTIIASEFFKKFPNAPICVISGHLDAENLFKTEAANIPITVMQKPFTAKVLLNWITERTTKS